MVGDWGYHLSVVRLNDGANICPWSGLWSLPRLVMVGYPFLALGELEHADGAWYQWLKEVSEGK